MKNTPASVGIVIGLVAAIGATGCLNVNSWAPPSASSVEPGVTHRDELYRMAGPPLSVYYRPGGGETLIYGRNKTRGLTAGVSIFYTPLRIGHARSARESIFIDVSRDDIVVSVRQYSDPDAPGYSIWPGGK
jgi:hypothetical protein